MDLAGFFAGEAERGKVSGILGATEPVGGVIASFLGVAAPQTTAPVAPHDGSIVAKIRSYRLLLSRG